MMPALRPLRLTQQVRFAHNIVVRTPAAPHTPPAIAEVQAPNRTTTWSKTQNPRTEAMVGPRFEQTAEQFQPRPLAAIELIAQEPVIKVNARVVSCDGGGGALGHPKIFINLDKSHERPQACSYCGLRYEKEDHHHGHH